jgi:hypothetical protein
MSEAVEAGAGPSGEEIVASVAMLLTAEVHFPQGICGVFKAAGLL